MNKTLAIATPTLLAALVALASRDAAAQFSSTAGKTAAAVLNTKVIGTITVTGDAMSSLAAMSVACSNFQITATAVKKVTQSPSIDGGAAFYVPEWTRTGAASLTPGAGCHFEIVVPAGSAFSLELAPTLSTCPNGIVPAAPPGDTMKFSPLSVALGATKRQNFALTKALVCSIPQPH